MFIIIYIYIRVCVRETDTYTDIKKKQKQKKQKQNKKIIQGNDYYGKYATQKSTTTKTNGRMAAT